jgi:hypothetical protein
MVLRYGIDALLLSSASLCYLGLSTVFDRITTVLALFLHDDSFTQISS